MRSTWTERIVFVLHESPCPLTARQLTIRIGKCDALWDIQTDHAFKVYLRRLVKEGRIERIDRDNMRYYTLRGD
jgi:hypothetical protein